MAIFNSYVYVKLPEGSIEAIVFFPYHQYRRAEPTIQGDL